tara:strand:+ start:315 stop:857 length:543 start_codon:yes stop_codon:yes gene_type:complete
MSLKKKSHTKEKIIIKYLASITPLKSFRRTPNVNFLKADQIISSLNAVDYVIHQPGAKSPKIEHDEQHYWYMHRQQKDNLIVHCGYRIIELYSKRHGKKETFEVSNDSIKLNGKIIHHGPAILSWPTSVFHRISSPEGSISTNYAHHYQHFTRKNNFNIYDLNIVTGEYHVVRPAPLDEK